MTPGPSASSIALVHDYLLTVRGAERTFEAIASYFPSAPIYTLLYDEGGTEGRFREHEILASRLGRLGLGQARFRMLLPLLPGAAERLPVRGHDLVISSSSAFAHGVRPHEGVQHVSYCYTPFRYAWHDYAIALEEVSWGARPFLRTVLKRIRDWDIAASRRVTHYIAISQVSQQRIAESWGRDATIVHPPVDVDRFAIGEPEDFFLVVAHLVRHKRIEIALEAARRAQVPIRVVGDGPDMRRLQALYGGSAQFLGRISDVELASLYSRARALVMPNIEEFGIAGVEAQAAGRPVVAAQAGGARETVLDGETGVLVTPESVSAFAEAMRAVDFDRFVPARIRENALRFSQERFRERFLAEVSRLTGLALEDMSAAQPAPNLRTR
jgi:glycosyltransferase involved in cell wall biosynthesis